MCRGESLRWTVCVSAGGEVGSSVIGLRIESMRRHVPLVAVGLLGVGGNQEARSEDPYEREMVAVQPKALEFFLGDVLLVPQIPQANGLADQPKLRPVRMRATSGS